MADVETFLMGANDRCSMCFACTSNAFEVRGKA